jgi:hypothetical protein
VAIRAFASSEALARILRNHQYILQRSVTVVLQRNMEQQHQHSQTVVTQSVDSQDALSRDMSAIPLHTHVQRVSIVVDIALCQSLSPYQRWWLLHQWSVDQMTTRSMSFLPYVMNWMLSLSSFLMIDFSLRSRPSLSVVHWSFPASTNLEDPLSPISLDAISPTPQPSHDTEHQGRNRR